MYIPYSQKPDHGSGEAGFIYGTDPWIYADLIFGERQPEGIIQKEQARNSWSDAGSVEGSCGRSGRFQLRPSAGSGVMEDDPNHASPNNFGDPLVVYNYSMRYGQKGDFQYSCLILPSCTKSRKHQQPRSDRQERCGYCVRQGWRRIHGLLPAAQQWRGRSDLRSGQGRRRSGG